MNANTLTHTHCTQAYMELASTFVWCFSAPVLDRIISHCKNLLKTIRVRKQKTLQCIYIYNTNIYMWINCLYFDIFSQSMSHPLTQRRPGLWPILQPATRGLSRCFGFTFGELSRHPSLYTVNGLKLFHWKQMSLKNNTLRTERKLWRTSNWFIINIVMLLSSFVIICI